MVKIEDNKNCCGCEACVQKCPKNCIELIRDKEGFLYPKVDESQCIQCGLCDKVCSCNNTIVKKEPAEEVYAYRNQDKDIVAESSSGGAFTELAIKIIENGGVVYGAAFAKDWTVHHICVDSVEELIKLRGSKYIQSHIKGSFEDAERNLKQGKQVLFSGTPCQIKGLKLFLRKDYENLLTVDFICHGVPSPQIWRKYLDEVEKCVDSRQRTVYGENIVLNPSLNTMFHIGDIKFRDKTYGWEKYHFVVSGKAAFNTISNSVLLSDIHRDNPFMKGFLSDIYLRPSCYNCPAKKGKSGSDIQMADFWGISEIDRSFYSPSGISMIIAQTNKGKEAIKGMNGYKKQIDENIELLNRSYAKNSTPHPRRAEFFQRIENEDFIPLVNEISRKTISQQVYYNLRVFLKYIGINHTLNKMKSKWAKK